jgi:hypothetical protein
MPWRSCMQPNPSCWRGSNPGFCSRLGSQRRVLRCGRGDLPWHATSVPSVAMPYPSGGYRPLTGCPNQPWCGGDHPVDQPAVGLIAAPPTAPRRSTRHAP